MTFSDDVKNLNNIKGDFFFEAEINKAEEGSHNVNLVFGNTNITKNIVVNNSNGVVGVFNEMFYKTGQILTTDVDNVQWAIRFNNKQDYFRGNDPAIIKDTLGAGMELSKDQFQFAVRQINEDRPRFYTKSEFETAGFGEATIEGNSFQVRANNPNYNELVIYYSAKIIDQKMKDFKNQLSVTYINKNGEYIIVNSNSTVLNINAGGKAEGDLAKYKGKVTIAKTGKDESNGTSTPLPGAEFELINLEGKVVAKGTTNAQGELVFENITGGTHTLKETKIPDGYAIDQSNFPNQIVLDFEKNKEIKIDVTNIKQPPLEDPQPEEPTTPEEPATPEAPITPSEPSVPVNPLLPEQPQPVYPNGSSQPTQNAQPNQSNALPNTGKVMQNHPFASTMIILSLIGLGLVLITFNRRKK
ncbi:SpaA isopeptide-forming pilin-related protein [Staphylococcus agnetis]|uniref:SpaA isopeptide-forming pilin-related protein n=1 Tax=Staphylococcus agnetis TaxID=985762 RepID=UPI00118B245F|nr:SpaA isopeptide-forming pilin-related protein [Staphylococcus agnetis]QDW98976.1 hypothetical protein DWB91_07460 [Staphylococcus agnetis]